MSDWQPIETAPKDGTHLLVCDARRPYTACWGFGQNPPTVGHYFVLKEADAMRPIVMCSCADWLMCAHPWPAIWRVRP